jgi:hypothetical protein
MRTCSFGLTMLLLGAGCSEPAATTPGTSSPPTTGTPAVKAPAEGSDGHAHGNGPHGGVVADWGGGKFHVEFTVDHGKKEATVYVLGDDAKAAAAIKAEKILLSINDPQFQTDLKAQPLDGETDGKSSRFVGTHENLGIVKEYEGTISGEIEGTPYAGEFKELP